MSIFDCRNSVEIRGRGGGLRRSNSFRINQFPVGQIVENVLNDLCRPAIMT